VQRYLASEDRLGDEEHRAGVEAQVRKAIRTQLLLDAVAEKVGVSVNQQELVDYIVASAQQCGMDPNEFAKAIDEAGQVPAMISEVARRKALTTLLEKAKVTNASGQEVNLLALAYCEEGRYGEAEPLFRESLQGRWAALGPRHPRTLGVMDHLAFLYRDKGRYDEAERLFREAWEGRRETLGPQHPHTLASANNLAVLYRDYRRYDEAQLLFRESLQGRWAVLGPRHPDTLASMVNLALLYQALEDFRRRFESFRALSHNPYNTLANANNLALSYRHQGRNREEQLFDEALEGQRAVLGPHHPETLATTHHLAHLYKEQGRHGDAELLLRQVLEARRTAGPAIAAVGHRFRWGQQGVARARAGRHAVRDRGAGSGPRGHRAGSALGL
jgi:tetratricopeptide (TPR) repeat protein